MAQVYLGSLMLVPYDFAPVDFAFCHGQLLPISRFTALFSLLGTTYGGDGRVTFALPDLRGRIALGAGQGPGLTDRAWGEVAGTPTVTLTYPESVAHQHTLMAAGAIANSTNPGGGSLAEASIYNDQAPNVAMGGSAIPPVGGHQPHNNMMPYLGFNWIISLGGLFPPRG